MLSQHFLIFVTFRSLFPNTSGHTGNGPFDHAQKDTKKWQIQPGAGLPDGIFSNQKFRF
jgi:hypothetical protein